MSCNCSGLQKSDARLVTETVRPGAFGFLEAGVEFIRIDRVVEPQSHMLRAHQLNHVFRCGAPPER